MSGERPLSGNSNTSKRPLHIHTHVNSIITNASGIAESIISNASDISGLSSFPTPPLQVPSPTLSGGTTPTVSRFTDRYTPTVQEIPSPARTGFGPRTPTTPYSPVESQFSGNVKTQDGIGHARYMTHAAQVQSSVGSPKQHSPVYQTEDSRKADVARKDSSSSSNSQRHQPMGPRAGPVNARDGKQSETTGIIRNQSNLRDPSLASASHQDKRTTPLSMVAPSSFTDWNDAASIAASGISGISVNPSEEALLTTNFITSLLSNSPEPFPDRKLSDARRRLVQQLDKSKTRSESSSQASGSNPGGVTRSTETHQSVRTSVRTHYPLDVEMPADVPQTARLPPSLSDQDSIIQSSTIGHSEEGLVQLVTRRPSISYVLGGTDKRPVGVMPAYRVSIGPSDSSYRTSVNSGTASTMSSKPPIHHADTPRDVIQEVVYDHENGPRDSTDVDNLANIGELLVEHANDHTSPALPSTAGTKDRFSILDAPRNLSMKPPPSAIQRLSSSTPKEGRPSRGVSLQRSNSRKSVVSSLISRISHASAQQKDKYMSWLRSRPLPPLPPMPTNPAPEFPNRHQIRDREESIPLPTLVRRADHLQALLNRGKYPTSSGYNSQYDKEYSPVEETFPRSDRRSYTQIKATGTDGARLSVFSRFRKNKEAQSYQDAMSPTSPKIMSLEQKKKRRRLQIIVACVIIGIILVIVIPVAIVKSRKSSLPDCPGNLTGSSCTLDATCICTGTNGVCKPLANSLNLLVPSVNSIFAANFTASQLSDAVTSVVGTSSTGKCAKQAMLIDVEPALDSATSPNRTLWSQSAILWNLGMSQDISATDTLQKFVSSAPWSTLSTSDGATSENNVKFSVQASGLTFNFAAQSVAPLSASFKDSSPSDAQLGEIPDSVMSTLDRMYSFAIASSTQRGKTLQNYWTDVLQQQQNDLDKFISAVQNSMFLLPFDATSSPGGHQLTTLMTNTSSTVFPPPISCFPGLNSSQIERINSLETSVFGLDAASSASNFNNACFPTRPVYGVVDLLRMRLPFLNSRQGVGLQAAGISQDAKMRAIVYSGEVLSALPGAAGLPSLTASSIDPREFGAINFMDHVILNYLSSISNTTLANELISFVLSSSTSPPSNTSDLGQAMTSASFPTLEFALFGAVKPQDIASSVSSFSTLSGGLFFGSDEGETFREWALVNTSADVAWTQQALSSQVVKEAAQKDSNFESVWTPASELAGQGSTDASDVDKVVAALQSLGLFSS